MMQALTSQTRGSFSTAETANSQNAEQNGLQRLWSTAVGLQLPDTRNRVLRLGYITVQDPEL
eukprot:scaffold123711_cov16-Prasinocladus_malaysianus.AAC.2